MELKEILIKKTRDERISIGYMPEVVALFEEDERKALGKILLAAIEEYGNSRYNAALVKSIETAQKYDFAPDVAEAIKKLKIPTK